MRKTLCVFLFGVSLLSAAPVRAAVFYPQTATLANGMQVVLIENKLSPAIAQMVWYKVGAVDDPPGKSGVAHFLEHMMFKGTAVYPAGVFSAMIAAQGGDDNAYTSYDTTAYHEVVAAEHLGLAMALEADRMRGLILDEAKAAPELAVVKSERAERIDNHPQGLFAEAFRAALFVGHPYARPIIGTRDDLNGLTARDAHDHYRARYAPQNAVLVVSGNIAFADVLRLAAGTFGPVTGDGARPPSALPLFRATKNDRVEMRDPRVTQASVMAAAPAPSRHDSLNRSYALEVLAEVLGGGEVGLLYRHFVARQKMASGISVSYDPITRGPAVFSWSAVPAEGIGARALEASVKDWLVQNARNGLDAATVSRAKQRLQDAAIFARDRLLAPAQIVGEHLAVSLPLSEIENWPARIAAVTPAQVNDAFRAILAAQGWVTGILEPDHAP